MGLLILVAVMFATVWVSVSLAVQGLRGMFRRLRATVRRL